MSSATKGVTEAGRLAHARRKFFDLWANHKSGIAEEAINLFARLYKIEAALKDFDSDERRRCRQQDPKPAAETLHRWLIGHRLKVPDGSAIARAIDYSLSRWAALTRYIDTGDLPADNNRVENLIRPIALGRSNWLFAGSLRAGKSAANIMSLLHTASTGMSRTRISRTFSIGCQRTRRIASKNCCPKTGSHPASPINPG